MGHCHSGGQAWAAAGFVDTLLRCEDETGDGYGKETVLSHWRSSRPYDYAVRFD